MTIYIKIEKDSDEVSVTFVSGDIHNTVSMTKEELIKYISGDLNGSNGT
jgi:hypothetical protein